MRLTCLLSRGVTAGAFTSRPFGNETKRNGMEGPGGLGDAVDLTPSKPRPHLRHPRPDRKPVWKIGLQTADQRAHVDMRACGPASASAKTEGRRVPFLACRAVLKHASLQRAGSRISKPAPPPTHTPSLAMASRFFEKEKKMSVLLCRLRSTFLGREPDVVSKVTQDAWLVLAVRRVY